MEIIGFILCFIIAIVIAVTVYNFYNNSKTVGTLISTSRTPIADFADGDCAKIVGKVRPFKTILIAPFTKQSCVYYRLEVRQLAQTKLMTKQLTILKEWEAVSFRVKDATGIAVVSADDCKYDIGDENDIDNNLFFDVSPEIEEYLRSKGIEVEYFTGPNWSLGYNITTITEGQDIAVLGRGKRSADQESILTVSSLGRPDWISSAPQALSS